MATTKVGRRWRERRLARKLGRARIAFGVAEGHRYDEGDDGLGGVREPRRPLSPLGTLGAEAPLD